MRFDGQGLELQKKLNEETKIVDVTSNKQITKGQELKVNPKITGDNLLIHHGLSLDNNEENDCYSLTFTFSDRKDDKLASERSKFYSKYFLFDSNHFDLIEECIAPGKPFDRRVLFYFYTLMMDHLDLEKEDPKRKDLHEDKLIINFAKDQFMAIDQLSRNYSEELEKYNNETNPMVKNFMKYKLQQRSMLLKVVDKYQDQFNFLIKDEAL